MDRNDIQTLTVESAELLKEMIAIPSPSFSEDEVCSHICNWLANNGIVHRRIENNIIARLSEQPGVKPGTFESRPTLMLCAHIDTVAPCEGYSFDPYSPDYAKAAEAIGNEEVIAGLGSNDDGASVVSMIAVFRRFLDCARNDKGGARNDAAKNLVMVLTCEEERSGAKGMTGLWGNILCEAEQDKKSDGTLKVDYAIVGEPTGMRAATSERGLLVIDGTAHGVSGHAARNEGVNAIEIALQDIQSIKSHEFSRISPRMGKVNLNITQINAGTVHNVIPDTCTFVIDIRPTEQYTNEEILAELQEICKSELKPRNLKNRSSATHDNSPLQKAAEALGIEQFSSPTTSDWMRIGCDAIKMGPGESSRSHRKDEFVYIKEIEEGIKTYIEFINNL